MGYKTNGADKAAFRHDTGPTGWQCPALDTTNLPASPYVDAGSATPVWASITQVGTIVNSLVSAPGMNPTYNVDIMRYLLPAINNGCAADIVGGTSGTPGLWAEIATADRQTGILQAHGLVRELAAGAFGVQGPLRFGNATGTASSWFEDSNASIIFEDRGFRTDLYKIFITDNGTGTTTFRLHGCALIAPPGVGAEFDADTDTDVTDVVIDNGSRIAGFIGGVGLQSGHILTGSAITGSGKVRANGATMNGSSVLETSVAANDSALLWNVATNPNGLLDNMTFSKGTADTHAIEFGTLTPTSLTLTGIDFVSYINTIGSNGSPLLFPDTGSDVTWSVILTSCTGITADGYKKARAGDTVTITADPTTMTAKAVNAAGDPVTGARTILYISAAGALPYLDPVTIINTTTTAAVTHTTHGLASNDKVIIRGADRIDNNGTKLITVTSVDTYEFTTTNSFSGADIGSAITTTFCVLEGVGDGNGDVAASRVYPAGQLCTGSIRKGSSAPYYKPAPLSGSISTTGDVNFQGVLIED